MRKRLTPEKGAGEDRIRFAPDGKRLLFESAKDGSSQIYVQDFDTTNGTLDRRGEESDEHLDGSFRRNLVAGW